MKAVLCTLLAIIMVVGVCGCTPGGNTDLVFTLNDDGNSYSVTEFEGKMDKSVEIPDSYKGLPVTIIGERAFYACEKLVEVIIPETVVTIDARAFYNCNSLESVTIPNSVTTIDEYAFAYCSNLAAVTMSENVKDINDYAFYECKTLTDVIIPKSVKHIGEDAFGSCFALTAINVNPDNEKFSSEDGVLFNKKGTSILQYPSGKTDRTYNVPDTVKKIGQKAFSWSRHLVSVKMKSNVKKIEHSAFYRSKRLAAITIPSSIDRIEHSTFYACKRLKSISIPEGMDFIGEEAFYGCTNLATITIPDSVKEIDEMAFGNTAYSNDELNWKDKVLYIDNHLIMAKEDLVGLYYVVEGTKTIANKAFAKCIWVSSVRIPNGLNRIGKQAFVWCERLVSVAFPQSISYIDEGAFMGCNELKYVFYNAPKDQWDVEVKEDNNCMTDAAIHYNAGSHTASNWIVDIPATIYENGTKHKECTICGQVLYTGVVDQLECKQAKLKSIENTSYGVKIDFLKVENATLYRVYRKEKDGKFEYLGSTKRLFFTDKTAKSGTKYYYAVRAKKSKGKSYMSDEMSIYYLEDPVFKTPTITKKGISLNWTKVPGAEGYRILRRTAGSEEFETIKTIKDVSKINYVDKTTKKRQKYTYKIQAYYSKTESACSNTKTLIDKY